MIFHVFTVDAVCGFSVFFLVSANSNMLWLLLPVHTLTVMRSLSGEFVVIGTLVVSPRNVTSSALICLHVA